MFKDTRVLSMSRSGSNPSFHFCLPFSFSLRFTKMSVFVPLSAPEIFFVLMKMSPFLYSAISFVLAILYLFMIEANPKEYLILAAKESYLC